MRANSRRIRLSKNSDALHTSGKARTFAASRPRDSESRFHLRENSQVVQPRCVSVILIGDNGSPGLSKQVAIHQVRPGYEEAVRQHCPNELL